LIIRLFWDSSAPAKNHIKIHHQPLSYSGSSAMEPVEFFISLMYVFLIHQDYPMTGLNSFTTKSALASWNYLKNSYLKFKN